VLAHLTVREPVDRALDLCTGNGIQALLLSRHARHVVATDVNERALDFARLNVTLNEVANVELRQGSLLDPVVGETFHCIACNPPYVVSPDAEYTFRDSGLPGDRVSELLARGLPALLEPGGFATLMASWAQAGDDPAVRPREWLDGCGCDAWILHTTTDDPLSNAAAWTRDAVDSPNEFAAALDRWTGYYDRIGIDALAYGTLVLRRRDGGNWSRGTSLPPRPLEPASTHLLRMFAGVDAAAAGPDALLARRLAVAPTARFEQVVSPGDGWTVVRATLSLEDGLGFSADVDEPTLRLLRALDGTRTAREAVAASLGEDELPRAAELLRGMLETGFLVPE
jgi:Methyltransferase small domain